MNLKQLFGLFLIVLLVNSAFVEAQRFGSRFGNRRDWSLFRRRWPTHTEVEAIPKI